MQQILTKIGVRPYIATRFPVSTQAVSGLVKRNLRQHGLRFKKILSNEKFITALFVIFTITLYY